MASPPNNYSSGLSPPYPPHNSIPNPKKRSTDMMPTSAPAVKRRKQSMISTTSSNHPLRQTSFPPDDADQGARYSPTPSIDNVSMVSNNTKTGGQSSKSAGNRKANDDDASSVVGGNGRGLLTVNTGGGQRGSKEPSRGPGSDDEDGHDGTVALTVDTNQDNSSEALKARSYIVREAMDPRQQERFDAWRASKLNTAMVKKLINQTLSQSVPETVVFAIRVAAKLFAGEIIERARKVREQYLAVSLTTQLGKPKPMLGLPSPPSDDSSTQRTSQIHESVSSSATMPGEPEAEKEARLDRELRGPLLPEHLREAFRRYKEFDGPDREMLNIWRMPRSTGAERFGLKNRKGRLFGGGGAIG